MVCCVTCVRACGLSPVDHVAESVGAGIVVSIAGAQELDDGRGPPKHDGAIGHPEASPGSQR